MVVAEKKVLDLGSYKTFNKENCISDKLKTLVMDEGGLRSPISISVVIPIKMDISSASEREMESEALHQVLAKCSHLVDAGYIDEILVMDATTDANKEIEYSILKSVVGIAYEELELFREQVRLLKKFKIENEKAKRGIYPFCFKAVHQFDRNIEKIMAQTGVVNYTGTIRTLSGKGSGLWLAIPICHGDIIAFVDSDIINFKQEFIIGLCHPIIYSWNENMNEPSIKMTKAYYNRLTVSSVSDGQELIIGGRTTRLFALPIIQTIVERYNLYDGLQTVKYPLSGEFSAYRDFLENLEFPNNYAIEMCTLFQAMNLIGPNAIANIDLEDFYHIGQSSTALYKMAIQILSAVQRYLPESHSKILSEPKFLEYYEKVAKKILKDREKHYEEQIKSAEGDLKNKLKYSPERDLREIKEFKKIISTFQELYKKSEQKTVYLPSWTFLKEQTGNYEFLQRMLSRRATQSTWTRLSENELIK